MFSNPQYKTIDQSEIDDFRNIIKNQNLDPDDFEINEIDLTDYTKSPYILKGKISIIRKSNNKTRTYNSGHGTSWPADFGDDLAGGLFGP
jgi:hypothetical protein